MRTRRLANQIDALESELAPKSEDIALRYTVHSKGFLKPDAILTIRFRFGTNADKKFYRVTSVRNISSDDEDYIEAKLERV